MCEIFGFSAQSPRPMNNLLREFYSHSRSHPDGWGLALFQGQHANIEKESRAAFKSSYLADRLRGPIRSATVLAHIRFATIGAVDRVNAHPYDGYDASGRHWTLIHNGTIFEFPDLMKYSGIQQGTTDSERILLYILDEIGHETQRKGEPLTAAERFDVLDRIVYEMSEGNKLNLLIYDGELMYAHYNSDDSLHLRRERDAVTISTAPLREGVWKPFPFTQLIAFQNGHEAFTGTNHGHRYIERKGALQQLLLTYSEL